MSDAEDDELYLMANLRPASTGLPMVVWVQERGRARHDVRVKVQRSHGSRIVAYDWVSVAVRPSPRLVAGQLSPADLRSVSDWIRLNEAAIIGYWDGRRSRMESYLAQPLVEGPSRFGG